MVTDAASWGFGSGFLDLEEIDEADFGIFGNVLDDVGEGVKEAGKDHGKKNKKKKTKKRKRGGDDSALVVENEQVDGEKAEKKVEDGEKGEKKGKRKRNRKKRKVKDNETSRESDEDVASDNAEGDYTH